MPSFVERLLAAMATSQKSSKLLDKECLGKRALDLSGDGHIAKKT